MAARSRACFCLAKAREPNAPVALQSAAHLRGLKLSELKARALEAGVDGTALDDALDSPNPRAAVAALVAAATDLRRRKIPPRMLFCGHPEGLPLSSQFAGQNGHDYRMITLLAARHHPIRMGQKTTFQ